jgi:hypothetical protein
MPVQRKSQCVFIAAFSRQFLAFNNSRAAEKFFTILVFILVINISDEL